MSFLLIAIHTLYKIRCHGLVNLYKKNYKFIPGVMGAANVDSNYHVFLDKLVRFIRNNA